MHYDGYDWRDVTPPGMPALGDVCALAPNDVWVAAADGVYHYDGSSWAQSFAGAHIGALHFSSPDNGWATYGYGGYLHWNGASWAEVPSFDCELRYAVFCPSDASAWAVGTLSPVPELPADKTIYHYKNGMPYWKPWPVPAGAENKYLKAVHFAAPDDGWAAGQAVVRWDGANWRTVACPYVAYDVFTLGGREVWLACEDGVILKYNP